MSVRIYTATSVLIFVLKTYTDSNHLQNHLRRGTYYKGGGLFEPGWGFDRGNMFVTFRDFSQLDFTLYHLVVFFEKVCK